MLNRDPADLFARLPGHHRVRDAEEGRALQALMEVMRAELGIVEGDIDQLYDNWFIETCEPWVLPYIADVVGARPMREIGADQAGLMRAYIANVLAFRQAKGTAAVIEQVAREVSGWSVVAVEFFQRLATSQHMGHLRPGAVAFADVRNSAAARTSRGPFAGQAHSAAAGQANGWSGRYNIPHLGLFIWRAGAAPIWPTAQDSGASYTGGARPAPVSSDDGLRWFDPMGRGRPLVTRPVADTSVAGRVTERMVPGAITRDALAQALDAARTTGETEGRWFEEAPPFVLRLDGQDVPPERIFSCNLMRADDGSYRRPAQAGQVLVDPELGRLALHAQDQALPVEAGYAEASVFDIGGGPYDRRESLERWLPDLVIEGEDPPWHVGVTGVTADQTMDPLQGGRVVGSLNQAIGMWNAEATEGTRGIISVMDNNRYPIAQKLRIPAGATLVIVAAHWPATPGPAGTRTRRPGQVSPQYLRPVVTPGLHVVGAASGQGEGGALILDGLAIREGIILPPRGDLGELGLFNCTAGGAKGRLAGGIAAPQGNAACKVTLHRSVLGGVTFGRAAGGLEISRCILSEDDTADGGPPAHDALNAPRMDARISGTTLFGRARLRSIEAENSLLLGNVTLEHRQRGCVRFCYAPPDARLPRRYKCVPRAGASDPQRPTFVSTRFADPGFAQLAQTTPLAILQGAEGGMEMGAGFANRDPARRANIEDALDDFAPYGLSAGLLFVT